MVPTGDFVQVQRSDTKDASYWGGEIWIQPYWYTYPNGSGWDPQYSYVTAPLVWPQPRATAKRQLDVAVICGKYIPDMEGFLAALGLTLAQFLERVTVASVAETLEVEG